MAATGFVITREEMEALRFISDRAFRLYVVLRGLMDFKTGRIGIRPLISWQALTEWAYVEPHSGIKGGSPSKDQMRRAAARLVDAGLVEMQSSEAQRHLIFFLPMAKRGFFVPKQPASNPPDDPARPPQRENHPEPARPKQAEPATHPVSVITNHHHHIATAVSGEPIQWSPALHAVERQQITKLLTSARLMPWAQEMADELTAAIEKGAIRNGAVPYARGLIERKREGTFTPTHGQKIAARRAADKPRASPVQRSATTEPPPTDRDAARAHIARMRAELTTTKGKRR